MPEATLRQDGCSLDYTAVAAITGGQVIQLPDGRAAVVPTDVSAAGLGAAQTRGVFRLAKTTSMVLLDGGRVYWDFSANKAHFKKVADQDFYVGRVVGGDAASAATTVDVALNINPPDLIDLDRDPFTSVVVGTQALGGLLPPIRQGGSHLFNITATNEAQKVDALSVDGFATAANAIIEVAFRVPNGGSGSASDFSMGVANASHASNADTITDSIFFHLDGGSTTINAECDDGTNETAATTTATTFTAGILQANRVEGWIDFRDPSSVKFYLDGVRVASGTTFSVAASTATWKLLMHVEKTSGTETADLIVDWARVRIADQ